MQGNADFARLCDPLRCPSGKRAEHGHAPTAARQQHHAGRPRSLVQFLRQMVAVEFGSDVEVVGAGSDRGPHQRSGRTQIGSGAVQENRRIRKRRVNCRIVPQVEHTAGAVKFDGEGCEPRRVASGEDEIERGSLGMCGGHAPGIAARSVDHQCLHGQCCQLL